MSKKGNQNVITFLLIVIICITNLPCLESYATEKNIGLEKKKVVKVGYLQNYGTIFEPQQKGYMGYGYDYLKEIAKYNGWEYEFVKCSWDEGIGLLKDGKIDIFGPLQKTKEREQQFDFPDIQMGIEYGTLFADKNRNILYEDFEFFDGMKVGTQRENYYIEVMDKYCEANGFDVTYVYTDSNDIAGELKNGKYDSYLTGDLQAIPGVSVVARLSFEPYYYATTKGNKEILDGLNMALNKILCDDKYFEQKLYEKYYSNMSVSEESITKNEIDLLKQYGWLTVGCDINSKPLQYVEDKNKQLRGISIDILKALGQTCGIEFKMVPIDTKNDYFSKEILKQVDLYVGYKDAELFEEYEKTDSYLSIPMMLVSNKIINLSDKLNITMYSFDSNNGEQLKNKFPQFTVNEVSSIDEALNSLHKGKADAIFVSTYIYDELERGIHEGPYYAKTTDIKGKMDIAVSPKLPKEIIDILNKGITNLGSDQINSIIYQNTASLAYYASISTFIRQNMWAIVSVIMFFCITLVVVIARSNKKLKNVLYIDSSTGKISHTKFKLVARELLDKAGVNEYMLVSIDVNNFKYINDIYGYDTGNKVLKVLADHIDQILPNQKLLMSRRAADNFVFICKTNNKQRIYDAMSNDVHLKQSVQEILGPDYNLALSTGIYIIKDPGKSISVMLDYANIAKKTIKGRVGNPIAEYTAEMDKNMQLKKKITVAMEAALLHGEFITCMQPKFTLKDGELIGAEVLARWKHPEMGLLPPLLFIPLFEENGFIEKLDLWIFENTCKTLKKWIDQSFEKIPVISVNISRVTLERENLVKDLKEIAEKYGVQTNRLEIEITEGTLENRTEKIIKIINELKASDFYVSIDDFGSGYSSLSILKDMPADTIKIDKEFLSETFDSKRGKQIINSVIKMSKELKLETVAEGIETKEQAEELKEMGCDIAQGYYFARPMTPADFEQLLTMFNEKNC
ncbi:MAG: EAL domain-containing protein [Aminipila sp.]